MPSVIFSEGRDYISNLLIGKIFNRTLRSRHDRKSMALPLEFRNTVYEYA